ncbi:MAG: hypothetical protein VYD19_09425, partial [Myxococcota bacterium]|nr:hypothetical protein [Myxococcota bacterium]
MTKHGLRPSPSLLLGLSLCSLLSAPICAVRAEPREQTRAAPAPFPGETQGLELYSAKRFQLSFEGYTQLRYQQIENDTELTDFVGRNDGFSLSNARLRITGVREKLAFRIELDGARDRREANNRARGEVSAEVLDAWLAFRPHRAFQLHAGRLKPLFDRS